MNSGDLLRLNWRRNRERMLHDIARCRTTAPAVGKQQPVQQYTGVRGDMRLTNALVKQAEQWREKVFLLRRTVVSLQLYLTWEIYWLPMTAWWLSDSLSTGGKTPTGDRRVTDPSERGVLFKMSSLQCWQLRGGREHVVAWNTGPGRKRSASSIIQLSKCFKDIKRKSKQLSSWGS